jgi:hypothetical protein
MNLHFCVFARLSFGRVHAVRTAALRLRLSNDCIVAWPAGCLTTWAFSHSEWVQPYAISSELHKMKDFFAQNNMSSPRVIEKVWRYGTKSWGCSSLICLTKTSSENEASKNMVSTSWFDYNKQDHIHQMSAGPAQLSPPSRTQHSKHDPFPSLYFYLICPSIHPESPSQTTSKVVPFQTIQKVRPCLPQGSRAAIGTIRDQ